MLVAASTDDYDGDGIKNDAEPCVVGNSSGIDSDKDGIDDACDGEYVTANTIVKMNDVSVQSHGVDTLVLSQEIEDRDTDVLFRNYLFSASTEDSLKLPPMIKVDTNSTKNTNNKVNLTAVLSLISLILAGVSIIGIKTIVVKKRDKR